MLERERERYTHRCVYIQYVCVYIYIISCKTKGHTRLVSVIMAVPAYAYLG